ncbi:hypothetical protein Pelo_7664 [Pelomyxa schiedti]|nr:hypothetical protein Pelo_7664 [Pelomyxa schiedti]
MGNTFQSKRVLLEDDVSGDSPSHKPCAAPETVVDSSPRPTTSGDDGSVKTTVTSNTPSHTATISPTSPTTATPATATATSNSTTAATVNNTNTQAPLPSPQAIVVERLLRRYTHPGDDHNQKLEKTLGGIRTDVMPRISDCLKRYRTLQNRLSLITMPEEGGLMSLEAQNYVQSVCNKEDIRLALYGATGAGKSSLVNFLCGWKILPIKSGHCTARVCLLKYAEPKDACIRSARVVDGKLVPADLFVSLAPYCDEEPNETQRAAVRDLLKLYLDRRNLLPENIQDLLTTVLIVEYPIAFLKAGIQLADLPGASKGDPLEHILSPFLPLFLAAFRPHGLGFCYGIAAFDKAENFAWKKLMKVMVDSDSWTPVFFVNTRTDLKDLAGELDIPSKVVTEAHLTRLCDQRLEQLLQAPSITLDILSTQLDFEPDTSFCIVGARNMLPKRAKYMSYYTLFMDRFVRWIVSIQMKACCRALEQLSAASGNFFQILMGLSTSSCEDIQRMEADAKERILLVKARILTGIDQCTQAFPSLLVRKVQEQRDAFLKEAVSLSPGSERERAEKYLAENLREWLEDNVISYVIKEVHSQIQKSIEENTRQLLNVKDEKVKDLLRSALPYFNEKVYRRSLVAAVGLVEAQRLELQAGAKHKVEDFISKRLNDVRILSAQRQRMKNYRSQESTEWDTTYWTGMRSDFGKLFAETLHIQDLLLEDPPVFPSPSASSSPTSTFSPCYSPLERYRKDSYPLEAIWNNQTVSVKVVDVSEGSKDNPGKFFEDLYHWHRMAQCSPHVLPLHMVFKQTVFRCNTPLSESRDMRGGGKEHTSQQSEVWCVVYPQFTCTLNDFLERHISSMQLIDALEIAKTIITAIRDIHEFGTVHGNLRLEAVVVNAQGSKVTGVAVAGFRTKAGSSNNSTDNPNDNGGRSSSSSTRDDENNTSFSSANLLSRAMDDSSADRLFHSPKEHVDILSFGKILSELTPKPKLLRCHMIGGDETTACTARGGSSVVTDATLHLVTARGTPPQVVKLISRCVSTEASLRPTAQKVVKRLTNICASPIEMLALLEED